MKKFSPILRELIQKSHHSGFCLLTIDFRGDRHIRWTTLPYDAVVGSVVYEATQKLLSLDPPKLASSVDKETFKVRFSDADYEMRPLCRELHNAKFTAYGGFLNSLGRPVQTLNGTFAPGDPILSPECFLTIYSGLVDKVVYRMDEDNGVILEMECASPMASLDATNVFYSTPDGVNQRAKKTPGVPRDTCFDNVSKGGKTQEILWGKV